MRSPLEASFLGPEGVRELDDSRFRPLAPRAFALHRRARAFDGVHVERLRGTAVEVRNHGAADTLDAMECVYLEAGQRSPGAETSSGRVPSHLSFMPSWVDHRTKLQADASYLVIRVDRAALSGIVPTLPSTPQRVPFRGGLMTATHAFAGSTLEHSGELSAVEKYATGQLLTEMVGSMMLDQFGFGLGREADSDTPSARLRDQAIAVIAQRRADPGLDVGEIAASVLASPRSVQAAFAEVSTTVSAEIRRQRAALAVHLLTTARYDVLGIDEIAREAGFGSALSMRRALQELYGSTPSQVRRRGASSPR